MNLTYTDALRLRARLTNLPLPNGIDRAEYHALLAAGVRGCLFTELDTIDEARKASKAAALEVSAALDWSAVAKRVRERDEFYRANPWAKRVVL